MYKKMSHIDTIIIDSKDRINGTTSNFTIKIPHSFKEPTQFLIKEITVPLVFDNVITGYNQIEVAGTTYTISRGLYTVDTLVAEMTTNITGYTFTITNGCRIKVKQTAAGNFTFKPLLLNTTLGFTAASYTGANEYISEELYNLIPTRYFTLHSDFISRNNKLKYSHTDGRSSLVMFIPITANLGEVYVYEPYIPVEVVLDGSNNDIIDLCLRDEYGDIVDLQGEDFIINIRRS
jgi:hypothetical protein